MISYCLYIAPININSIWNTKLDSVIKNRKIIVQTRKYFNLCHPFTLMRKQHHIILGNKDFCPLSAASVIRVIVFSAFWIIKTKQFNHYRIYLATRCDWELNMQKQKRTEVDLYTNKNLSEEVPVINKVISSQKKKIQTYQK